MNEADTQRASASEDPAEIKANRFQTPEKKKKLRRRLDGSPVLPPDPRPPKKVFLIRHGQSLGQMAKHNGMDRRKDQKLLDCGLTSKGETQASQISQHFTEEMMNDLQLVVSSPLTRALHTALLGFPTKDILVAFDLRELGSRVPENHPRSMKDVCRTLATILETRSSTLSLDMTTLQPKDWPRDCNPTVTKIDRIRKALQLMYREREETTIAIVCHFNVIRSAIVNGEALRPRNAIPICCKLFSNGDLILEKPD